MMTKLEAVKALVKELPADAQNATLLTALVDLLDEVCDRVDSLRDNVDELSDCVDDLSDELESIDEAIGELADELLDECEECEHDGDCDCCHDEDEDFIYEIPCPSCAEMVELCEADLDNGFLICPFCQQKLTIGIQDACGCGCEHDEDDEDSK